MMHQFQIVELSFYSGSNIVGSSDIESFEFLSMDAPEYVNPGRLWYFIKFNRICRVRGNKSKRACPL